MSALNRFRKEQTENIMNNATFRYKLYKFKLRIFIN